MDHKVSKDMISSGMIPSGEKTQADLGRTQYGSTPSPSKLMDAYKSMYDKKEEVINEMSGKGMGMTPAPKPQGITPASKPQGITPASKPQGKTPAPKTETSKTDSRMDQVVKHGFAKSYRQIGPKSETEDMLDKVKDRQVDKAVNRDKDVRRARASYIMTKYGESVDLLAAYRSIYEHHKKDADGNTIPHEDEEVNEGKIPAGLQAYLDKKKGKKEDKKEMKEGIGMAAKAALGVVKNIAKKETVKKLAGDVARGAAMQAGGSMVGSMMSGGGQQKQKTGTVSASADLFDIVKGQLLDEGYSEKEANEIMVNLTEEQLEEFLKQLATRAAQYGANIGREGSVTGFLNQRADKKKVIDVINPKRKPFDAPTSRKPFDAKKPEPKPGESGFRAKSASDVVKAVSAADKPKPTREKLSPEQKTVRKEITDKMKTQSQLFPIRRKKGEVMQDNADLFDIVKGQLLDEGLSKEEIRDIMLTLTPDEIMKEMNQ